MSRHTKSPIAGAGSVAKIAIGLVLPILAGFFLGSYLDDKLNSSPWITLLLILIGISTGFWWLYKSAKNNDE